MLKTDFKDRRAGDRLAYSERERKFTFANIERKREDLLIETFNILTDQEKVDKQDSFQQSKSVYSLRAHEYKIAVKKN